MALEVQSPHLIRRLLCSLKDVTLWIISVLHYTLWIISVLLHIFAGLGLWIFKFPFRLGTNTELAPLVEVPGAKKVKYYPVVCGKTRGHHKPIMKLLKVASEVSTPKDSDVILAFCPVVSRLGTDVEAALKTIQEYADSKPVILVVMHHTFDPDATVPRSHRFVQDENIFTVDCLFHEDLGLLACGTNEKAYSSLTQKLCELKEV
ncbi:uncharacterized protein LOC114763397 isoform X1 [Denticeps clupeoides]|uniref:uncharacterized protein LOC114763397 isoform X1 n=1 Tax=Denticeps clupeoides TaxID=299321 RepID=UPI0010A30F29|nr:uncharacterized protein LOC114763397 isoform X1 [Denticeps clupeoides]XP_028808892.1 uncharacterized protein LOC114763397 isoform X1 [Denticeps clupeoides]XP_028808893.1 uncharacterized protein LOC114763397 isoform X1 [Denticeps clupeoides]